MEPVAEHYMCHFDPDLVGREILYGSSLMPITGEPQKIPPLPRLNSLESGSVGMTLFTCATCTMAHVNKNLRSTFARFLRVSRGLINILAASREVFVMPAYAGIHSLDSGWSSPRPKRGRNDAASGGEFNPQPRHRFETDAWK
ncbi:MAG: hypothetical protein M1469_02725 [Bacteroidetes bacterium]|nr:hypothetical protein [Bacteroidota bacterium]